MKTILGTSKLVVHVSWSVCLHVRACVRALICLSVWQSNTFANLSLQIWRHCCCPYMCIMNMTYLTWYCQPSLSRLYLFVIPVSVQRSKNFFRALTSLTKYILLIRFLFSLFSFLISHFSFSLFSFLQMKSTASRAHLTLGRPTANITRRSISVTRFRSRRQF